LSASFSRSLRLLQSGGSGRSLWTLLLVTAFIGAWLLWFLLARVPLLVVADTVQLVDKTRAVAHFAPSALARIQPGQSGQLRLEDFPWTEYGAVAASVASVGKEVRDGRIQVELRLYPDPNSAIPLQRGLTGALIIEVEHVSPAAVLLRELLDSA